MGRMKDIHFLRSRKGEVFPHYAAVHVVAADKADHLIREGRAVEHDANCPCRGEES